MHSPRTAWRDFKAVWSRRSPEKTLAIGLSLGITLIILVVFFLDAGVNTAPPVTVTYVESFPADRTDEQIKTDQIKDQRAREERARARQEQFQEVANRLGIE